MSSVALVTKVPLEDITKKVRQVGLTSHVPLVLLPNVARETALEYKIRFTQTAGVRVMYAPTRRYDTTPGLSHILGYTSQMTEKDSQKHPDYAQESPIGRVGLESSYDAILRGEVGISEIEVNATGQFQRTVDKKPPRVGDTLQLSIDRDLQSEMAAALTEAMAKESAKQSVGVAMDPQTGAILASVSLPSYDNNVFEKGISADAFSVLNTDPNKPLINQATSGRFPPGSTIKPFVAAAALEEKTIYPNTTLDTSEGVIVVGQQRFPDWKTHGLTTVATAIAESNNIFFYALGGGYKHIPPLGIDRLARYYTMFGFGEPTGVDYTSENQGFVPTPEWKKRVQKESWFIGNTYHVSIGQGDLLVTPTQMARAVASLVNGGRLVTPHVVVSTQNTNTGEVKKTTFPEEKLPLSDQTIATVREGMRLTVNSETGSARSLRSLPFTSGGKTGTAQFGAGDNEKTHAWYVGYAPLDNPKIVVAIIVEGGGEGNAISVPVAGRVFQKYLK